ncbi:MAG: thioredoxin [Syntrophaceae bacterium]|nr:thioredoxin [Syntrophaceae bacterium]
MVATITDENFKREVSHSKLPLLVDFWAPWCMPCHMLAPAIEAIAKKYSGKLKVFKANVDETPGTASAFGIMSIPTVAIFNGGKLMKKNVGVVPQEVLEDKIKTYV